MEVVRFSERAGESAPRMSFAAADVKVARPAIGRYSWFKVGSLRRISSAWKGVVREFFKKTASESTFLTTGKTHGFALSSRYAPIPKSTFLSEVSALKAVISPKRGSSGACGTTSAGKLVEVD